MTARVHLIDRAGLPVPGRARAALREATHEVHERLHCQEGFAALVNGTLTRSGYRDLLVKLYGFHRPLEDALLAAPRSWWFDLELAPRLRADRIAADLLALGLTSGDLASVPLTSRPRFDRAEHLLGCLYVREGATLGGKVLARKLDSILGSGDHARSFFASTSRDGALWGELCATLDCVDAGHELSAMIAAACGTFAALEAWLAADNPPILTGQCR
jgi:heme oxygenase (biliverdin-IX-beta and delta-forming)